MMKMVGGGSSMEGEVCECDLVGGKGGKEMGFLILSWLFCRRGE